MDKKKHGGFRANAKRPFKYGEPTVLVQFKVPVSKREAFIEHVKEFLKPFIKSKSL